MLTNAGGLNYYYIITPSVSVRDKEKQRKAGIQGLFDDGTGAVCASDSPCLPTKQGLLADQWSINCRPMHIPFRQIMRRNAYRRWAIICHICRTILHA